MLKTASRKPSRSFSVTISTPSATAWYHSIFAQDADHAVGLAVAAAEREFAQTGWLLEHAEEA
jgi:hypothetical protein